MYWFQWPEAGAILVSETGKVFIEFTAPKGECGEFCGERVIPLVCGIYSRVGYFSEGGVSKSLHIGIAAGSASAFSEELASRGRNRSTTFQG